MPDLTDQQRWGRIDSPWRAIEDADAQSIEWTRAGRLPIPAPAPLPKPVPVAWHVDILAGNPDSEGVVHFTIGATWNETTTREYFDTEAEALAFFAESVETLDRTPRPTMRYPNGGRAPFCRSVEVWAQNRYPSGRIGCFVKVLTYEEERCNV